MSKSAHHYPQADTTGRTASVSPLSTVALLNEVCSEDTQKALSELKLRSDVAVKREEGLGWVLWNDTDVATILDNLTISDDHRPEFYDKAWRNLSRTGSVKDLDALSAAYLEMREISEWDACHD